MSKLLLKTVKNSIQPGSRKELVLGIFSLLLLLVSLSVVYGQKQKHSQLNKEQVRYEKDLAKMSQGMRELENMTHYLGYLNKKKQEQMPKNIEGELLEFIKNTGLVNAVAQGKWSGQDQALGFLECQVSFEGEWRDVLRWVYDVEASSQSYFINHLIVKKQEESKRLKVDAQVKQYFLLKNIKAGGA